MSGTVCPDIGNTGFFTVFPCLGGNSLQHGFQLHISLPAAARHEAGTVKGPFFAAADTHAHKFHAQLCQLFAAPAGIFEIGVAAVNDNVAGFQQGRKGIQHGIYRSPCLDHQNDLPGPFQILYQFFQTVSRLQTGIVPKIMHKLFRFGSSTVKHQGLDLVICQITGQVSAHNR